MTPETLRPELVEVSGAGGLWSRWSLEQAVSGAGIETVTPSPKARIVSPFAGAIGRGSPFCRELISARRWWSRRLWLSNAPRRSTSDRVGQVLLWMFFSWTIGCGILPVWVMRIRGDREARDGMGSVDRVGYCSLREYKKQREVLTVARAFSLQCETAVPTDLGGATRTGVSGKAVPFAFPNPL